MYANLAWLRSDISKVGLYAQDAVCLSGFITYPSQLNTAGISVVGVSVVDIFSIWLDQWLIMKEY